MNLWLETGIDAEERWTPAYDDTIKCERCGWPMHECMGHPPTEDSDNAE